MNLQKHKESTRRPLWLVRVLLGQFFLLCQFFGTFICLKCCLSLPKPPETIKYITTQFSPKLYVLTKGKGTPEVNKAHTQKSTTNLTR